MQICPAIYFDIPHRQDDFQWFIDQKLTIVRSLNRKFQIIPDIQIVCLRYSYNNLLIINKQRRLHKPFVGLVVYYSCTRKQFFKSNQINQFTSVVYFRNKPIFLDEWHLIKSFLILCLNADDVKHEETWSAIWWH